MRFSIRRYVAPLVGYWLGATFLAACNVFPAERIKRAPLQTDAAQGILKRAGALGQSITWPVPCGEILGAVGYLDTNRPIGTFVVQLTTDEHTTTAVANAKGIFEMEAPADSAKATLRISLNGATAMKELQLGRFEHDVAYRMTVVRTSEDAGVVYTSTEGCAPKVP